MRKLFITLTISTMLLFTQHLSAQNNAYNIGDKTASIGLTLGYYSYGFAGNRTLGFPPITFTGEYGFHEYISAGAFIGFGNWNYDYGWFGSSYSYSYTVISGGARASFHYVPFLNEVLELDIDQEKFDFYISMIAGLEFQRSKTESDFTGVDVNLDNDVSLAFGPIAGFKYMLNDNLGIFVEPGWNALGYFTFGVSGRF
jgi:hypothetical protein